MCATVKGDSAPPCPFSVNIAVAFVDGPPTSSRYWTMRAQSPLAVDEPTQFKGQNMSTDVATRREDQ